MSCKWVKAFSDSSSEYARQKLRLEPVWQSLPAPRVRHDRQACPHWYDERARRLARETALAVQRPRVHQRSRSLVVGVWRVAAVFAARFWQIAELRGHTIKSSRWNLNQLIKYVHVITKRYLIAINRLSLSFINIAN